MSDDPALRQRQWIETGYVWLDEHWADESLLWRDVRVALLAFMGVTDEDLASNVDCRALGAIVDYVDGLPDHDVQRAALLTPDERDTLRENAILEWEHASAAQPAPAAPAATFEAAAPAAAEWGAAGPGEAQWVDGHGWMRFDQITNSWVAAEAPAGAEPPAAAAAAPAAAAAEAPAEPAGGAAATSGGEAQWVDGHGWMRFDATANSWVAAEAPAGADAAPAPAPSAAAAPAAAAAPGAAAAAHEEVPAAPPAPEAAAPPAPEAAAPPAPEAAPDAAAPAAETPPAAPPAPDTPLADAVTVGGTDPELAAAVAELPAETAELLTSAVTEELAPVIEEMMANIEGLEGLSDEDIQAAFAAAVAEAGLAAEAS